MCRPSSRTTRAVGYASVSDLAVALAGLGRLDEVRIPAKEALAIDPTFTIRRYREGAPSDNPVFLAGRQRIYELMRKVGVPEG